MDVAESQQPNQQNHGDRIYKISGRIGKRILRSASAYGIEAQAIPAVTINAEPSSDGAARPGNTR